MCKDVGKHSDTFFLFIFFLFKSKDGQIILLLNRLNSLWVWVRVCVRTCKYTDGYTYTYPTKLTPIYREIV